MGLSGHASVLVDFGLEEVSCPDFYRDLFFFSHRYRQYQERMQLPVTFSEMTSEGGSWRSFALFEVPEATESRTDAYISPCTFFPYRHGGKTGQSRNGGESCDEICAFVLDIDRGSPMLLEAALNDWWANSRVPIPTFIVCSGHGLHLYYQLSEPVAYRTRWRDELDAINSYLYSLYRGEFFLGEIDRHGCTQPYRVVGSLNKEGTDTVSAFRLGTPYSATELAVEAGLGQTVFTIEDFDMKSSIRSQRYRESLERDGTGKKTARKGWNPGFYRWLAKEEKSRAPLYGEYGHRYKQVIGLSIAAKKDRIPKEQLEADVRELHDGWNACSKKHGHPGITWKECQKAMRYGDWAPFPQKFKKVWLQELVGFKFGEQKRNGQSIEEHLKYARKVKAIKVEIFGDKSKGVPPTKMQLIRDYAAAHPDANHSEIARALGVSRTTVIKWLKSGEEDGR